MKCFRLRSAFAFAACLFTIGTLSQADEKQSAENERFAKWEKAIAAFEKQDAKSPPKQGGVLFVGSSSIRGWKLDKSFPKREALNRGFGGSQIIDSIHFADRIILNHKPRIVVLYAGDNDIAAGKKPERVFADFKKFVRTVQSELPKTKVVFIAIKPSIKRWMLSDKMSKANKLIRDHCGKSKLLEFADIWKPMLGKDGKPRMELFGKDGLHLNEEGYRLWAAVVKPHIK